MSTPLKVFLAIASAALIFGAGYVAGIKQTQAGRYVSAVAPGVLSITDTTTGEVRVFRLSDAGAFRFSDSMQTKP